jgi:hypothetical protein
VTAAGLPGGQTETGKWLLKAMDAVERRTTSSREKMRWIKSSLEIRARMEELAFQMQQDAKSRWVYEWPMKTKVKVASQGIVGQKTVETVEGMVEAC